MRFDRDISHSDRPAVSRASYPAAGDGNVAADERKSYVWPPIPEEEICTPE
jgi:hypothetical protein